MLFGYFEETIPLSVRLFLRKSDPLTEIRFWGKIIADGNFSAPVAQ